MIYLFSILSGIIQGLTEFIPVSSSGHLILFRDIFNFSLPNNLLFDVVLHLGTLGAILIYFRQDVWQIMVGFFSSLTNWHKSFEQKLAWYIIFATIPAALAGYFFEDIMKNYFRSTLVIAIMLIMVAIFFFLVEKYYKNGKQLEKMNWGDALLIGLAQALAFIPGTSRSGITIITGMSRGLKREQAARFSFLLGAPIIFGAGFKKLLSVSTMIDANITVLFLGFLVSLIVGYLAIKYFLFFVSHYSLKVFAWYRLIIGCLILVWVFLV